MSLEHVPVVDSEEDGISDVAAARSGTVDGPAPPTGGAAGPSDTAPIEGPANPPGDAVGRSPSRFRCVGSPPRQTEDPLAPPCVAFYDGDNGGTTHTGVDRDEIRVLVYLDGGLDYASSSDAGNVRSPSMRYFDLFEPPEEREHFTVRALRTWQRYFNERFQTYGRRVHMFVFFTRLGGSPEERRAHAADNFGKVRPFAVVSFATESSEDAYLQEMANRGVLNFGSFGLRRESFFRRFRDRIWSYPPSLEQHAATFSTYVCSKVVGRSPSLAAADLRARADQEHGGRRRLGILHTTDGGHPGLVRLAQIVRRDVELCDGRIEATATFPTCCFAQENNPSREPAQQMADFKSKGITTILWPGGLSGAFGKAAAAIGYQPEWIVLGDGTTDAAYPQRVAQNSGAFDGRAVVITPEVLEPALEQQRCHQAYREVDTEMSKANLEYTCGYYRNLFQLFTGIQVAGPSLTPASIGRGFRSIPAHNSSDPSSPACFYGFEDHSCVKDATVGIWRGAMFAPGSNQPGCWALLENGRRFGLGSWPGGNVDAQLGPGEVCTGYDRRARING